MGDIRVALQCPGCEWGYIQKVTKKSDKTVISFKQHGDIEFDSSLCSFEVKPGMMGLFFKKSKGPVYRLFIEGCKIFDYKSEADYLKKIAA